MVRLRGVGCKLELVPLNVMEAPPLELEQVVEDGCKFELLSALQSATTLELVQVVMRL